MQMYAAVFARCQQIAMTTSLYTRWLRMTPAQNIKNSTEDWARVLVLSQSWEREGTE